MSKVDQIKKLLTFLKLDVFTAERPFPEKLHEAIYKRLEDPNALRERDHACARFEPTKPLVVHVFAYDESHHNGSYGNYYRQDMAMFNEFVDHALDVLTKRAHEVVAGQLREDERRRFDERVNARLREMGLA